MFYILPIHLRTAKPRSPQRSIFRERATFGRLAKYKWSTGLLPNRDTLYVQHSSRPELFMR
jgi:hypothetical protein